MNKKTYLVTGGNSGLGFECGRALASSPEVCLVIACRDLEKGEATARRLRTVNASEVRVMSLDLSSLDSVRRFAADFKALKMSSLDGLVCNAGIQEMIPSTTREGFETTFGVNHLGHFLLSLLMLPQISTDGRIIFVASGVHDPAEKTGMPDPRYTTAEEVARDLEPGQKSGQRRYATSKLCNVYCAYQLGKHLAESSDPRLRSIQVAAFDPGLMPGTGLARQYSFPVRLIWTYILPAMILLVKNVHTAAKSGKRLASLVTHKNLQVGGKYFSNGKEKRSSDLCYDIKNAEELWSSSLQMTGLNSWVQ